MLGKTVVKIEHGEGSNDQGIIFYMSDGSKYLVDSGSSGSLGLVCLPKRIKRVPDIWISFTTEETSLPEGELNPVAFEQQYNLLIRKIDAIDALHIHKQYDHPRGLIEGSLEGLEVDDGTLLYRTSDYRCGETEFHTYPFVLEDLGKPMEFWIAKFKLQYEEQAKKVKDQEERIRERKEQQERKQFEELKKKFG